MKKIVVVLCVCLVLVACDGGGADDFENAQAVADAMEDEGIKCEDLETTTEFANEEDSLVEERGLCRVNGNTVVISMFENSEKRDDWVAVGKLFGQVAVGENWVVSAESEDVIEDVVDSLGATIPEKE
jgi:hypothetical protein